MPYENSSLIKEEPQLVIEISQAQEEIEAVTSCCEVLKQFGIKASIIGGQLILTSLTGAALGDSLYRSLIAYLVDIGPKGYLFPVATGAMSGIYTALEASVVPKSVEGSSLRNSYSRINNILGYVNNSVAIGTAVGDFAPVLPVYKFGVTAGAMLIYLISRLICDFLLRKHYLPEQTYNKLSSLLTLPASCSGIYNFLQIINPIFNGKVDQKNMDYMRLMEFNAALIGAGVVSAADYHAKRSSDGLNERSESPDGYVQTIDKLADKILGINSAVNDTAFLSTMIFFIYATVQYDILKQPPNIPLPVYCAIPIGATITSLCRQLVDNVYQRYILTSSNGSSLAKEKNPIGNYGSFNQVSDDYDYEAQVRPAC